MKVRLLSMRPGRLPWPSIDVTIHVTPSSVVSGVESLDWPWILINASLQVEVLQGENNVYLGNFRASNLTTPQRLEFTINLGYDGLAVVETARQGLDVTLRLWGHFSVAWFSPDEEGKHFVATQYKSGGVVQEEGRDTVRIPLSDWQSTYLASWGKQAPMVVWISDPLLIEALRREAELLGMTATDAAIEALRRRLLDRLPDEGKEPEG